MKMAATMTTAMTAAAVTTTAMTAAAVTTTASAQRGAGQQAHQSDDGNPRD
jgi:hypothetical protein